MNNLIFPPIETARKATYSDGVLLCKLINENVDGIFPALTGGLVYKDGSRKDIDIVLYRHRQDMDEFETEQLKEQLLKAGVEIIDCFGFVTKCKWLGFSVDLFNPESKITLEERYGDQ